MTSSWGLSSVRLFSSLAKRDCGFALREGERGVSVVFLEGEGNVWMERNWRKGEKWRTKRK